MFCSNPYSYSQEQEDTIRQIADVGAGRSIRSFIDHRPARPSKKPSRENDSTTEHGSRAILGAPSELAGRTDSRQRERNRGMAKAVTRTGKDRDARKRKAYAPKANPPATRPTARPSCCVSSQHPLSYSRHFSTWRLSRAPKVSVSAAAVGMPTVRRTRGSTRSLQDPPGKPNGSTLREFHDQE